MSLLTNSVSVGSMVGVGWGNWQWCASSGGGGRVRSGLCNLSRRVCALYYTCDRNPLPPCSISPITWPHIDPWLPTPKTQTPLPIMRPIPSPFPCGNLHQSLARWPWWQLLSPIPIQLNLLSTGVAIIALATCHHQHVTS